MTARPTVLLVDDDPNVCDGLRRAFHREPWEVVAAGGAPDALEILAARPVDVVIADQAMPDMSGLSLLTRVCTEHPETIRMMLTGHGSLDLARRAITDGHVSRFFTKPCDPEDLKVAIRQSLEQRALLMESRRLLPTVRRQAAALEQLQSATRARAPRLTALERDEDGAIVLDDVPTDPVELLKEVQQALEAAEDRLQTRAARPTGGTPDVTPRR
jgi:two-component system, probable response regulator PhcQ